MLEICSTFCKELAEVGKDTFESNGDEAFSNESLLKRGDEAFNKESLKKSNADEALNEE
jgi:hypothetical protein